MLPGLSTSPPGAVGLPQSPGRPSLHADPPTPERVRAAPESMARTSAFAQQVQARPTRLRFDAAGFTLVTACSFASPPFGPASRRSPEISLPGSSGGLPRRDSHPLVVEPLLGGIPDTHFRHRALSGRASLA